MTKQKRTSTGRKQPSNTYVNVEASWQKKPTYTRSEKIGMVLTGLGVAFLTLAAFMGW